MILVEHGWAYLVKQLSIEYLLFDVSTFNQNFEIYNSYFWAYAKKTDDGAYILYEAIIGRRMERKKTFVYGVYRFG